MNQLNPPLDVIEEALFGPSDDLLWRLAHKPDAVPARLRDPVLGDPHYRDLIQALREPPEDTTDAPATVAPPMPVWLAERVARRAAARAAPFPVQPAAGQVRLVDRVVGPDGPLDFDLPRPLAVCLDAPYPGRRDIWHGWLVGAETDYATEWDVLLTEDDGPADPLAGMVQLWNPVYAYLPSTGRVLAQLSPERVAALHAVAAEFLSGAPVAIGPRPGHVGLRETPDGQVVLTGTPLGGDDDPRHRYRTLYRAATAALREPVTRALDAAREAARRPGPLEWLREALASLGGEWQPGPALAHAMGIRPSSVVLDAAVASVLPSIGLPSIGTLMGNLLTRFAGHEHDGASPAAYLEGALAGRVRLLAQAEEGLLALVVCWLGGAPVTVRMLVAGDATESWTLDADRDHVTLHLDESLAQTMIFQESDGAELARVDLPAAGPDADDAA